MRGALLVLGAVALGGGLALAWRYLTDRDRERQDAEARRRDRGPPVDPLLAGSTGATYLLGQDGQLRSQVDPAEVSRQLRRAQREQLGPALMVYDAPPLEVGPGGFA